MLLYAMIGTLLLLIDQFIKYWTVTNVDLNTGIVNLPGLLQLTHVKNFGIMFGVLQEAKWLRWVLFVLMLIVAGVIIFALIKRIFATDFAQITACLFVAGILSNGIDRVIFGHVVDMFEFKFGNLPIFNLADILAIGGGIAFCISLLCGGIRKEEEAEEEPPAPVQPVRRAPVQGAAPAQRPASAQNGQPVRRAPVQGAAPTQRPAAPVRPAAAPVRPAPAPQAAPKTSKDDFDLDAIMAEFK